MVNQTPKVYLPLSDQADEPVTELRASLNNALLAVITESGVALWERRSNQRFVLSWEQILEQRQHAHNRP